MEYDTAQICRNGDVITSHLQGDPGGTEDFCSKCGSLTITACDCGEPIRGRLWSRQVHKSYSRPAYCQKCGKTFPWTTAAIQAAEEFALQMKIAEMDRTELPKIIEGLVSDTSQTVIAAERAKRLLEKVGPSFGEGLKQILSGVITEGAKKMIWPGT